MSRKIRPIYSMESSGDKQTEFEMKNSTKHDTQIAEAASFETGESGGGGGEIGTKFLTPEVKTSEFNLEDFRLDQNFEALAGIKKLFTVIPVKRPDRQSWIQVHPDKNWRMNAMILELREDRENYLITPNVYKSLNGECTAKYLITCITKSNTPFLWPIRMPGKDGRFDSWSRSALEIVNNYAGSWIRIISNMEAGGYQVFTPNEDFPPPIWPEEGFESLVEKAFKGRIVTNLDHPIVKPLWGDR